MKKKGKEIGALDYSIPCPICGSKAHTLCNKKIKI